MASDSSLVRLEVEDAGAAPRAGGTSRALGLVGVACVLCGFIAWSCSGPVQDATALASLQTIPQRPPGAGAQPFLERTMSQADSDKPAPPPAGLDLPPARPPVQQKPNTDWGGPVSPLSPGKQWSPDGTAAGEWTRRTGVGQIPPPWANPQPAQPQTPVAQATAMTALYALPRRPPGAGAQPQLGSDKKGLPPGLPQASPPVAPVDPYSSPAFPQRPPGAGSQPWDGEQTRDPSSDHHGGDVLP